MSQVQKLVVTRQTTVELTTDGTAEPLVNLEAVGRQMIEGAAAEGAKEIEAGRAAEEAEKKFDETTKLESESDVRGYANVVTAAAVAESLDFGPDGGGFDFLAKPAALVNANGHSGDEPETGEFPSLGYFNELR